MSDAPWYAAWFGEEYLRLYPHRDQEEAVRAVALLAAHLPEAPGGPVLDLGCGAGRHLRALREEGVHAVGLDLSAPLLQRARAALPETPLVRADMRRIPFAPGVFAAVSSFFTSFGYFLAPEEDRGVLLEIHRVLRPDGRLLLDFLNARRVREALVPRDEREVDGSHVVQERRLVAGGRLVEKTIRITDPVRGLQRSFLERVRLYEPEELEELLVGSGFRPLRRFGDYGGGNFTPAAPRCILLSERTAKAPDSPSKNEGTTTS